jgi:hypothetical protein
MYTGDIMSVLKLKKWEISLYFKGKNFLIFRNSGWMKNKYYLVQSYNYVDHPSSDTFFKKIMDRGNFVEHSSGNTFTICKNYLKQYWIIYKDSYSTPDGKYGYHDINVRVKVKYIKKAQVLSLMVSEI